VEHAFQRAKKIQSFECKYNELVKNILRTTKEINDGTINSNIWTKSATIDCEREA